MKTGWLAVTAAVIVGAGAAGCSSSTSDPFQLKVGDCLRSADPSGLVEETKTMPCDEPHAAEVYDSITVTDAKSYPGKPELERQAGGCAASFKDFVGKAYSDSDLKVTYFHPTEESWKQGDRQILCIVSVPTGTVTGSLKGSIR